MGSKKELATAAAVNAVAAWSKRNKARQAIVEGGSHTVDLQLTGSVDSQRIKIPIIGKLAIGLSNPTGSTSRPNMADLLASALDEMPRTRREKWLDSLKSKDDIQPGESSQQLVTALVSRLSTKGPRAGAVQFVESTT